MKTLFRRLSLLRQRSLLSLRLLAWVLIFSLAFTFISSAIQLYSDYRKELTQITARMQTVESSDSSGLARSLWALDQKLLQIQLEGILSLPDIVHLRLAIEPGSELVMGEILRDVATVVHSFELVHVEGDEFKLGRLTITADLARVNQEMRRRVGIILATQFLQTLFISILIIWIFQFFVTRHLTTMADYAREFSIHNLKRPLTLNRPDTPGQRQDELGQVTDAINQMRGRLNQDIARQAQDALEIQKFSQAIEQSPSSVIICDRQWHIEFVNQKFSQLTGHNALAIIGKHPGSLGSGNSDNRDAEKLWKSIRLQVQRVGVWQGEVTSARRNGKHFWEQLIVTPIKDAKADITGFLILGEDISIRKRYERQLLRQANYDILTGLPNRMLALDRLKLALAQARRENTEVGVMFLDLDNFKHINDTLGHDAGDTLLIEAARRISSCLRGTSTVARLGGDEFLVILPGLQSAEVSSQVAERILETFSMPYQLNGHEVYVTTSIGIAAFPADSDNSSELMQHADAAMYQAKREGKSDYVHFSPEMSEISHERLQLESRLRHALQQGEFELFYQPIVDISNGNLMAAEALLRWNNPEIGLVMPDRFIPLAEETGLITAIGEWAIRQACQAAMAWKNQLGRDVGISVNVSPRQFRNASFVTSVMDALSTTGLAAEFLELEITERLTLDSSTETAQILRELDEHGVRLSIDDFGTGYSALSRLKSYPFDTLKIDNSFVRDILKNPDDAVLVSAIINMAHSMRLRLIAEGVEEEKQVQFLQKAGCDCAQGCFYSRPLPAIEFSQWLDSYTGH
jgi:diguanylate cyclase (GGDEF)-like protein/PAS domain S-box-containing protein